jgi:hypothetical protein
MRAILAGLILVACARTASAQYPILTIGPWQPGPGGWTYNPSTYYTPSYYAGPRYYGGYGYGETAYELRRIRHELEDANFQRRWSRFNDRGWLD